MLKLQFKSNGKITVIISKYDLEHKISGYCFFSSSLFIRSTTMNILGCLLSLQNDDFVMLAADTSMENVLVHILSDVVKKIKVGEKVGIAGIGIAADRASFLRDLAIEFEFFKVRNHRELQLESAVHFVNKQLIKASTDNF
ncbi:uncharacterized protein LOC119662253 isoform X2 [Teleopsis dalmanni]|uniref:uncharacterized protein LOC119662253 isoform X2 n=1 Tax=Teleopsis dalmanni TaxID=139649 RepID=UPI0018CDF302|nr:uncharacterized protein LOC119662253 isoform X2 [Teleopsis dalmanni]